MPPGLGREILAQTVEHLDGYALGIGVSLEQKRRHCSDQHGLSDSTRSMATDVARDFSAAGGVSYHRGFLEIKSFDHSRKIVGIAVHVIAG